MIIEIGIVGGEIWSMLERHGEVALSSIVDTIDKSRDIILMSLGWLAREKHIILQATEKDYIVSLRKRVETK